MRTLTLAVFVSVVTGLYLILNGLCDHLLYYVGPSNQVFLLDKLVTLRVVRQQSVDALEARRRARDVDWQVEVMTKDQVVGVFVKEHLDRFSVIIIGKPVQSRHLCLLLTVVGICAGIQQLSNYVVTMVQARILISFKLIAVKSHEEQRCEAIFIATVNE